ncbi:MAG: hypothetical protein GY859_29665, partial [Desulfobacterales bacterium]|nr:hypothetical protein [Desulfobacterales bacterium]
CQGVYRTLDGGDAWDAPNAGLLKPDEPFYAAYFVLAIEVDPSTTSTVYAGTQFGLFKSVDRASSWTRLPLADALSGVRDWGFPFPIGAIQVDPDDGDILYAGFGDTYFHETPGGFVVKSADGGQTWRRIGAGVINENATVYGIALDPDGSAGQRRLVVSTDNGVYLSENSGTTFSSFGAGLPHARGRRVVAGRSTAGPTVFYIVLWNEGNNAESYRGGVYRWRVGSEGWVEKNGVIGDNGLPGFDGVNTAMYNWIDLDPANPDLVYVATASEYDVEFDDANIF